MELVSSDGEIRVYSDLRYIEAVSLLVSYSSLHGGPNAELEKCLRIFVEVYLSRSTNVELLIQAIDSQMSLLQDEMLVRSDIQHLNHFNFTKICHLVDIVIDPALFFIKTLLDHDSVHFEGI